jgi:hypothetical protein
MKKWLKGTCLVYVLLVVLSFCGGCGMVTTSLLNSCTRNEPDVQSFNAAYWRPAGFWSSARLIVDYSVQEPRYPKQEKRDSSYWADISVDGLAYDEHSHPQDGVTIHRYRLSENRLSGCRKLPIRTMDDMRRESGSVYVWDYLGHMNVTNAPLIVSESNWLAIRDKTYTHLGYKRFCPTHSYIPLEQYPKLIGLYPFAILGDIVTFPLVLVAPRWHD